MIPGIVYICHPFGSDIVANTERIRNCCRELALAGYLPLAPQLLLPQFLDETTERDQAMSICLRLLAVVDEVRIYGEPTEGMRLEIAEARRLGVPVVNGERISVTREPPR